MRILNPISFFTEQPVIASEPVIASQPLIVSQPVIASEAKQSAKRNNLCKDCHVASLLAVTDNRPA